MKKGFTLMELLIVIAILGTTSIIITISLSSILKSSNDNKCKTFISDIEEAACIYAATNEISNGNITMETLVSNGLINYEKDCEGNDLDNSSIIIINTENSERKCTYNKSYGE